MIVQVSARSAFTTRTPARDNAVFPCGLVPMPTLPDPRPLRAPLPDCRLAAPILAHTDSAASADRTRTMAMLVQTCRELLAQGDAEAIRSALDGAWPEASARTLVEALDQAINATRHDDESGLLARVFLLPILFVSGGKAPARVSGVVPDIGAVTGLLKDAGALGPVETFGLSNALGTFEAARAVSPVRLFELVRNLDPATTTELLAPADLEIDSADEEVHLRYLAGASLTPTDMPMFLERAGQVGRWGMSLSHLLARQLGEEGLSLLPLPRAPRPWFTALEEGRFAREELAFNLFATGAIRRIRTQTGDPEAEIAACDDGTISVELTSPFDPMLRHSHAWKLSAADDLGRVELSIRDLLRDCRVEKVTIQPDLHPPAPPVLPGEFTLLRH